MPENFIITTMVLIYHGEGAMVLLSGLFSIGITPDKPWYMQNFTMALGLLPQTMVKFCIYHGLGGVIHFLT